MQPSKFRMWVHNFWLDHQQEVEAWTGQPIAYTKQQYFKKYRWWLKTVYKMRQTRND